MQVVPYVTTEITYMSADEEDHYTIAQANAKLDDRGQFEEQRVASRRNQQFRFASVQRVDYMDVAPRQIVGQLCGRLVILGKAQERTVMMDQRQDPHLGMKD